MNGKTKHTPGEWVIENNGNRINITSGYKGFVIAEVTGPVIYHFLVNKDQPFYNAKLISIAPKLLDACIAILDDDDIDKNLQPHHRGLLKELVEEATKDLK
jgi:hypothetical protein